jgi:hypothetical protein
MKKRGCFWAIASWGDWLRAKFEGWILGEAADYAMFQWACAYGSTKDMQVLLSDRTKRPRGPYTHPVLWAIEAGNVEALRVLFTDGRDDPSKDGCYNLQHALRYNNDAVTREICKDTRVQRCLSHRRGRRRRHVNPRCLESFLLRERDRQALCMAWIGTLLPIWQDMVQPLANIWHADFFK